jgi:hypothetical protein
MSSRVGKRLTHLGNNRVQPRRGNARVHDDVYGAFVLLMVGKPIKLDLLDGRFNRTRSQHEPERAPGMA